MSSNGRTIKRKETMGNKLKKKRQKTNPTISKLQASNVNSTEQPQDTYKELFNRGSTHETNFVSLDFPSAQPYTVTDASSDIRIQYTANAVRLSELSTKTIAAFKEHVNTLPRSTPAQMLQYRNELIDTELDSEIRFLFKGNKIIEEKIALAGESWKTLQNEQLFTALERAYPNTKSSSNDTASLENKIKKYTPKFNLNNPRPSILPYVSSKEKELKYEVDKTGMALTKEKMKAVLSIIKEQFSSSSINRRLINNVFNHSEGRPQEWEVFKDPLG